MIGGTPHRGCHGTRSGATPTGQVMGGEPGGSGYAAPVSGACPTFSFALFGESLSLARPRPCDFAMWGPLAGAQNNLRGRGLCERMVAGGMQWTCVSEHGGGWRTGWAQGVCLRHLVCDRRCVCV
jgi:hypothetical protein